MDSNHRPLARAFLPVSTNALTAELLPQKPGLKFYHDLSQVNPGKERYLKKAFY